MKRGTMRNAEGYFDPTASTAIHNIESAERKKKRMENRRNIERGSMYYIEHSKAYEGSEQYAGRPAIVVSNDKLNATSDVVEVVYLTTQEKNDMPTHVQIRSSGRLSTALCEQIISVSTSRVNNYVGTVTDDEMRRIEAALMISLGIKDEPKVEKPLPLREAVPATPIPTVDAEKIEMKAQLYVYKNLYEDLLAQVMNGEVKRC